jgi:hypothetical protein
MQIATFLWTTFWIPTLFSRRLHSVSYFFLFLFLSCVLALVLFRVLCAEIFLSERLAPKLFALPLQWQTPLYMLNATSSPLEPCKVWSVERKDA